MKAISKIMLGAAVLLLIPLVAMQFTDQVNWSASDFLVVWVLLAGIGFGLTTVLNKTKSTDMRAVGGLIIVAFIWLWIELAVGLFTNWGS